MLNGEAAQASLIRRFVRERLVPADTSADSLWAMVAADDFEPAGVDGVLYE